MPVQTFIDGGRIKYVSVNGGRTMYLVQNGQTIYHEAVDFSRSATANGSIGAGSTANGSVPMGTSVTVIATPDSGYAFSRWERGSGGEWATVSNNATYTFTMDASWREPNHQIRAVFAFAPVLISVRFSGGSGNFPTAMPEYACFPYLQSIISGAVYQSGPGMGAVHANTNVHTLSLTAPSAQLQVNIKNLNQYSSSLHNSYWRLFSPGWYCGDGNDQFCNQITFSDRMIANPVATLSTGSLTSLICGAMIGCGS